MKKTINRRIAVRMYKTGTGDFFLLRVFNSAKKAFHIIVDCGSYKFNEKVFDEILNEMFILTGGTIDLLIVSHEHKDHIYGFEKGAAIFSKFRFKKVWFAWTEDEHDPFANDLRENYSKIRMAIHEASMKLSGLVDDQYFRNQFQFEANHKELIANTEDFVNSIQWLDDIASFSAAKSAGQTMVEKFKTWQIIKKDTEVEFREPGEVIDSLPGLEGIRFFILGPPRDLKALNDEGDEDDYYSKREKSSTFNFELIDALLGKEKSDNKIVYPFEKEYVVVNSTNLKKQYNKELWKCIDSEWLINAGTLALKFERCLNNTSLVFAMQLESNEHILLFPGDAEFGNWNSWFSDLTWNLKDDKKTRKVDAKYILQNTVFYKAGHHLSQNGTPKAKGIDLMTHKELQAFIPVDLDAISSTWKNTMPNDYLGAFLIEKTHGRTYISGSRAKVLKNIQTKRVTIDKKDLTVLEKLNKPFDDKSYVETEVV